MTTNKISALVRSTWLRHQIMEKNKTVKILDCSWTALKSGKEDFLSKHIPRSIFFDLNRCVRATSTLPRNLPDPDCFEDYVQNLGVNSDSHVIVYDRGAMLAAARTWWTFRAYGHEQVSVLDGGLNKWEATGNTTESGRATDKFQKGNFKVKVNPSLIKNFEDMQKHVTSKDTQIVDARRPEHFHGAAEEPTGFTIKALQGMDQTVPASMSRGHIPGAKNLLEDLVLDPESKCLLPVEKLLKVFKEHGIDLSKPMTTMCYNGHAATLVALAAHLCGKTDTSIYYGSWTEWGQLAPPEHIEIPAVQGA